jgi:hypothetical protein
MSPRGLLALLLLGVVVLVFAVLAVALVELRSHRTVAMQPRFDLLFVAKLQTSPESCRLRV